MAHEAWARAAYYFTIAPPTPPAAPPATLSLSSALDCFADLDDPLQHHVPAFTVPHTAICTARHAVGPYAEPPRMLWARPVT